jgi:hypothetical protein
MIGANGIFLEESNGCSIRWRLVRTCSECGREFRPSSRHKRCPRCRFGDPTRYDRCRCGARKQRSSASCTQCCDRAGEASGTWRGGRTRTKAGYVMRLARDHPRAPSNSGYVFEHILVMEQMLGRFLLEDENVHHLNGVKDDNRPENLELWVRAQPSGARASDLVEWAKEILRRYGDTTAENA